MKKIKLNSYQELSVKTFLWCFCSLILIGINVLIFGDTSDFNLILAIALHLCIVAFMYLFVWVIETVEIIYNLIFE